MKEYEISFEEKKKIQLEMLKEIDAFCEENKICYSLAFGTLLGAIRHKGFIPWDDDVDIMMPLPDMLRFKELFKSEKMKYCDVDTDKDYEYEFSRIINTDTYNKKSHLVKTYGLCIDLYPLVSIPQNKHDCSLFFQQAIQKNKIRLFFIKWHNRFIRYLSINAMPGFHRIIKRCRDYLLFSNEYGKSGVYYIVAGPYELRNKMTYDFDLFKRMTKVEFEGFSFPAIACFDIFLSMRYGDYMQLPPKEEQHPYHGGHYYWKK